MKKEDFDALIDSQKGTINIVLIVFLTLAFVLYSMYVMGDAFVLSEFPANATNASATTGIADGGQPSMGAFNGTGSLFSCNVTTNASAQNPSTNISNVSLFIQKGSEGTRETAVRNATINSTGDSHVTLNATETGIQIINFTNETTQNEFDEGEYFWFCEVMMNSSSVTSSTEDSFQFNFTTVNRSFIIDKTPPGFNNISGNLTVVNTSNSVVSTEDIVYVAVNASDQLTSIHTVRLFVNVSGLADNEVNITTDGTKGAGEAGNNTLVNLSFRIPGNLTGHVLNFTLQVNDSVNNINITSALVFSVDGDGTVPGPINLSNPLNLFNTTSISPLLFNFSAVDNNDTFFNCDVNITLGTSAFDNISTLNVTSGVAHLNTSTRSYSNGTYSWNVTCTDGPGNFNTSVTNQFTVDQIPPVVDYFNITNTSTINATGDDEAAIQLNNSDGLSRAQGGTIFGIANWTDNLTQPFIGLFQFYNTTTPGWQTLNTSSTIAPHNGSWTNFSFPIPTGHNEFEGANVSFRIIANDTLGNINNSASVKNITVTINDTTVPTITINGTLAVNGTNITDTTPTISWSIAEGSALTSINVSLDGTVAGGTGVESNCNKYAFFDTTAGANNVEKFRNFSFTVKDDAACTLANGTHYINLTAIDTLSNSVKLTYEFNVQSGGIPALQFNLTAADAAGTHSKAAVNNTNITSSVGITLFGTNGVGSSIDKIAFTSSCNSSTTVVANNTVVYPFNDSSCNTQSENRILTVTINDTSGNKNTTVLGFLVDNVAPTFTSIVSPTEGQSFTNINVSLNFSVQDDDQAISFYGYYLIDGVNDELFTINISAAIGGAGVNITDTRLKNHTGRHILKFTVNDTLGNTRNSSEISFIQSGAIDILGANKTIFDNNKNVSNVSFFDGGGNLLAANTDINQTMELFISLNETTKGANITINFNGSLANWNLTTEIYANLNDSTIASHLRNNQTTTIVDFIFINNSFARFLPNNDSYFGKINMVLNATNIGGTFELWYFPDENDLTTKTNITECLSTLVLSHSLTSGLPCWNATPGNNNLTVDVYVPHFSIIAAVNNTEAPTVNVTFPGNFTNVTSGMFVTNITVSADAVSCISSINGTVAGLTMTKSGNVCIGQTERFKNNEVGNFTFNVTDSSGNINTYIWEFNISDTTAPDNGPITRSVTGTTTANVIITGTNESVNATVNYGTTNTSLGSSATETDFNVTQTVGLSGLTADTKYYFNVTVCDFNGNCKTNTTVFSFTTDAAAAAAAAATTTSGGGGGGVVVSNIEATVARQWDTLTSGSSATLTINNEKIAVTEVTIEIKNEVTKADIKVQSLRSNPLTATAAAKVYQYLQLTRANFADSDTSKITIKFRVPNSWLTANGVSDTDITLWRFSNSQWNLLPTTKTGTDASNVFYEATTPGFSTFAIGNKVAGSAELVAGELVAILDMIDSFYATGSPTLLEILDSIDAYYSAGGG